MEIATKLVSNDEIVGSNSFQNIEDFNRKVFYFELKMKTLSLKHAISKGIYLLDDIEEFCSEKKIV